MFETKETLEKKYKDLFVSTLTLYSSSGNLNLVYVDINKNYKIRSNSLENILFMDSCFNCKRSSKYKLSICGSIFSASGLVVKNYYFCSNCKQKKIDIINKIYQELGF